MRTTITLAALVALLLAHAPAGAQSVAVAANASDLNMGQVLVFPVRLERGTRAGYLVYVPWFDAYAVAVAHPTRSGPLGMVPVGGLCIETLFTLPAGNWWQFNGPKPIDGDGDGDDDLVLQEVDPPQRFRVINLDTASCR